MKTTKKPLSGVPAKKELQGRLQKCYICSKFLPSASQLTTHIEQHQNKINRTTVEQIQRKTQESFRSKRQPSALMRTNSKVEEIKPKEPIAGNGKQNTLPKKQEDEQAQVPQESYEDALRQSQILLEKIDFLTQVPQEIIQKEVIPFLDEERQEECTIEGDYQLYMQLRACSSDVQAQSFIIRTRFQDRSFQNYQEQLKHLNNLMKIAVNNDTVNKIWAISKNITRDITNQLKVKYDSLSPLQGIPTRQKQIITTTSNQGEIRYCSVCYTTIEAGSQFMQSQFAAAYHKECLQE